MRKHQVVVRGLKTHGRPPEDVSELVYVSMEEALCPPCRGLVAEYDSALEALLHDTDVSVFVLTIRSGR